MNKSKETCKSMTYLRYGRFTLEVSGWKIENNNYSTNKFYFPDMGTIIPFTPCANL